MKSKRYRIGGITGVSIVDNFTNHVVVTYSHEYEGSAEFHLKILNGEVFPHWEGDVLTWHTFPEDHKLCLDCRMGTHGETIGLPIRCDCPCHGG